MQCKKVVVINEVESFDFVGFVLFRWTYEIKLFHFRTMRELSGVKNPPLNQMKNHPFFLTVLKILFRKKNAIIIYCMYICDNGVKWFLLMRLVTIQFSSFSSLLDVRLKLFCSNRIYQSITLTLIYTFKVHVITDESVDDLKGLKFH